MARVRQDSPRGAVIGIDAHKESHTLVAVDAGGRKLAEKVVAATSAGHAEALKWARARFGPDILWGVEDVRNVSGRLERDLLTAGQRIKRVPTKLMARSRSSGRAYGKSDPIDALAVARAVLREPDLPVACHDEVTREFKLLVDRREDLVAHRSATITRLRWRVHELDPVYAAAVGPLDHTRHRDALSERLATIPGVVAELARAEVDDIAWLSANITTLTERITRRVREVDTTLVEIPGCGALTAAKIIGETANVTRFGSNGEASFARYCGAAPIPHWSGVSEGRLRASRVGNRSLNSALHRIAVTQIRMPDSAGYAYYRRRVAEGDTKMAALRSLKRRLVRVVYRQLLTDHLAKQANSSSIR